MAIIPLWIDCDPGHDDAFAILLATHPRFHLLGISTVFGNAAIHETTRNALSVLEAIGASHVPVFKGADRPWKRERFGAEQYHGETGLAGTELLPKPSKSESTSISATQAMRDALLAQPRDTAWLVAIGPLTNIANLLSEYPEVGGWVKGISVMGGAIMNGYTTAQLGKVGDEGDMVGFPSREAEFNVWSDPHAAAAVLESPQLSNKITIATLDLTHQVLANRAIQAQIFAGQVSHGTSPGRVQSKKSSSVRRLFKDILSYNESTYLTYYPNLPGPPLHDPVAVLLTVPEVRVEKESERWQIRVEVGDDPSGESFGRTLSDGELQQMGCWVPRSIDQDLLWQMLGEALERASSNSN